MSEENRPFKVGDRVLCEAEGFGTVERVEAGLKFPLVVRFDSGRFVSFFENGVEFKPEKPTLHHANTGVIEIDTTDVPDLEVDHPFWVRDYKNNPWYSTHFHSFTDEGLAVAFVNGATSHSAPRSANTKEWKYYRLTDPAGDE